MLMKEQQKQSLVEYLTKLARKREADKIALIQLAFQTRLAQVKEMTASNMYSFLFAEI